MCVLVMECGRRRKRQGGSGNEMGGLESGSQGVCGCTCLVELGLMEINSVELLLTCIWIIESQNFRFGEKSYNLEYIIVVGSRCVFSR